MTDIQPKIIVIILRFILASIVILVGAGIFWNIKNDVARKEKDALFMVDQRLSSLFFEINNFPRGPGQDVVFLSQLGSLKNYVSGHPDDQEAYKQIAKDLEISKDVIFTGYVVGDELVPLFKNADFFVMPSLYEGFGTTVLEAFATGTPAIVSGVSSIPELAGDAAILVSPLNTKEIADAMIRLAGDENLKNELREKGKKQVEKFNWEKCASQTLDVYKNLVR